MVSYDIRFIFTICSVWISEATGGGGGRSVRPSLLVCGGNWVGLPPQAVGRSLREPLAMCLGMRPYLEAVSTS